METQYSKDTISYKKKIIFNAGVEASLEYANPESAFVPNVKLLFSPFGLPFVPIEILGTDLNSIISDMTWSKDRNNPGGIFQATITPDSSLIQDIVDIINKFSGNLYSRIWGELGVDLEDLFKPMTLCQVWINGYHLVTGTVRSCIRSATVSNESKQVAYTITVDELGNLYNKNTMSLDMIEADGMQAQIQDALKTALSIVATTQGVTLSVAISAIIEAFKLTILSSNFTASDGFPLYLRMMSGNNPLGGIANFSFANNMFADVNLFQMHSQGGGQQSIWSYIKNFIPNPWMELFTDSGGRTIVTDPIGVPALLFPGFNYVVARSVPYSNPMIGTVNPQHLVNTLPFDLSTIALLVGGDFIIITDDIIKEKSLGQDCVNQCTVFHTRYTSGAMGGGAMDVTDKGIKSTGPLNPFASGGIDTFGVVEMFQDVNCINLNGMGTAFSALDRISKNMFGIPFVQMSKNELGNLLAVWFRNQSRFREGTVTTRGIPYARPGMYCLYLPALNGRKPENLRDIGIYYIDSLSHSYNLEDKSVDFTTTLNLIRGIPLPTTIAQTALLLFDFEILPPESGLFDGEYRVKANIRQALKGIK